MSKKKTSTSSNDEWYLHEALDRTNIIMDMIERNLLEHPAILDNPIFTVCAAKAWDQLHALYDEVAKVRFAMAKDVEEES